jgi:ubiquinone/menaquinone biosynthesis C-methylase UbiE
VTELSFGAPIAALYEQWMVPLLFEPYARDLAARARRRSPSHVLELAAGTGAVTRELAGALPSSTAIVATDLNQAMIDRAAEVGTSRPVEWRHADAMRLPFPDAAFDLVVCQFGVMFFTDRVTAYAEMRRVLRPGGRALFNTWDRLAENDFEATIHEAVAGAFPVDPPTFFARVPHSYFDPAVIRAELAAAGFTAAPLIETVTARSRADSAYIPALALCAGSPLRNEIEARDASRLEEMIATAMALVEQRFGPGPVEGRLRALVVEIER